MSHYLLLLPLGNHVDTVKRHQSLFGKRYKKQGKSYEYPGLLSSIPYEMLMSGVYRLDSAPSDYILSHSEKFHFVYLESVSY
jgi:hypothetical protein